MIVGVAVDQPGRVVDVDVDVVARIGRGDRDALELLYWRHAGWLTSRLTFRCRQPDLVDAAVQDTFLAVWQTARRYDGRGEVGAWIWGIGLRRLIDQLRRAARHGASAGDVVGELVGSRQSAEDEAIGLVLDARLAAALAALTPELRAVMVATVLDGLTTNEAAVLLGIPAGTVKTRMMRARASMRAGMEGSERP